MRILSIDPGKGSGWTFHNTEKPDEWQFGCFIAPEYPYHHLLYDFLWRLMPEVIVYERFVYRNVKNKGVEMPGVNLLAVEMIGIILLYEQKIALSEEDLNVVLYPRNPGQGFKLWTDDKLKKLGLYQKGQKNTNGAPHTNDATRHLLDFLIGTCKLTSYLEPLRPDRTPE